MASGMTIPIELSIVAVDLLLCNIFVSNFGSRAIKLAYFGVGIE